MPDRSRRRRRQRRRPRSRQGQFGDSIPLQSELLLTIGTACGAGPSGRQCHSRFDHPCLSPLVPDPLFPLRRAHPLHLGHAVRLFRLHFGHGDRLELCRIEQHPLAGSDPRRSRAVRKDSERVAVARETATRVGGTDGLGEEGCGGRAGRC